MPDSGKGMVIIMTLKEIAALAGVSVSTVSRVINHPSAKAAGPEVENRIWEIVRQNGYTPNISARNLKLGIDNKAHSNSSQKTIACIFARSDISDPFFSSIFRAIEQEACRCGYVVRHIFSTKENVTAPCYEDLLHYEVGGVAVLGRFDRKMLVFLQTNFKRVVYTGLNMIDSKFDQIICDGYLASKTAVMYLAQLGHTKIAYIGEKAREYRYRGYIDALKALNIPLNHSYATTAFLSSEGGYKAAKQLLSAGSDVTALFCANDLTAIGAIKAVKELGYKIPNDISVIGIDDIEMSKYIVPMLTTIHIPQEELGVMTARILIDRIENGNRLPVKVELPFELIRRESCSAAVPRKRC